MANVIEVRDLVRRYGDLTAVDAVSFEVREGEIFGFLGPNGAGKTTTINVLCTLLKPSGGAAVVNGHDVTRDPNGVRRSIGLIFQEQTLDDRLSGMQNLRFHAMLYDVPKETYERRAAELLDMVELTEKAKDNVKAYSGGMRRRLEIARGLLHHPRVLFLDEPTIGLDPQTRAHIWEYLVKLREEEGLTLFLTTHQMEEAEICDRIAIIDHGRIIALDTPEGLKDMVGGDIITLETSDDETALSLLRERRGFEPRKDPEGRVIVEVDRGEQEIPRILRELSSQGVEVRSVRLAEPTLEDVFLKLTGRTIREEEASAVDRLKARRKMMHGRR